MSQDQTHPQERKDSISIENLSQAGRSDYNLAELARLCIRYQGFPGAREIQAKLQGLIQAWGLTEESLYATTRELHQTGELYRKTSTGEERQDWS
ncbi:MAG: DUF3288 family protein [Jaaginema sp. PMC 1079.18]|nr:DUF3288 family protein [Jaaginema sp. PMC 1080.18]MEC4852045.1 DUF3288 family protein [Jaaginema sp. PMC 1079.18]MEC4864649.1 DUF3288 family protein [Jaaginema sp. PMC 1078.18]